MRLSMTVDGTYDITLDSPIGRQKATLDLITDATGITGTLTGGMGSLPITGGSVRGNDVHWTMEGTFHAAYAHLVLWDCTATVNGESISGTMEIGELGSVGFRGSRIALDATPSEERARVIEWRDLGKPRYEAVSVEWVNALAEYVEERFGKTEFDFDLVWSVEYRDPPQHLLRGDGRVTVGYHFRAGGGKIEVGDGPADDAELRVAYPYDPFALNLRMPTDEYVAWVAEYGRSLQNLVETRGDLAKAKLMSDKMAGINNDIREEFLSQQ